MGTALILLVLALSALIGLKIGMRYKLSNLRLKVAQLKHKNAETKEELLKDQNKRLCRINGVLQYKID